MREYEIARCDETFEAIRAITDHLKNDEYSEAVQLAERLAARYDQLISEGLWADSEEAVYYDFDTFMAELSWSMYSCETREVRLTSDPVAMVYYLYGCALYEVAEHAKAIEALEKALRWAPSNVVILSEIAENHKSLRDFGAYEVIWDSAHRYIREARDMAAYHRAKGYCLIEKERYELAAAHLVTSCVFEVSEFVWDELEYIESKCGVDYTDLLPHDAIRKLMEEGEVVSACDAMFEALRLALEASKEYGASEMAAQYAESLARLGAPEEVLRMVDELFPSEEE